LASHSVFPAGKATKIFKTVVLGNRVQDQISFYNHQIDLVSSILLEEFFFLEFIQEKIKFRLQQSQSRVQQVQHASLFFFHCLFVVLCQKSSSFSSNSIFPTNPFFIFPKRSQLSIDTSSFFVFLFSIDGHLFKSGIIDILIAHRMDRDKDKSHTRCFFHSFVKHFKFGSSKGKSSLSSILFHLNRLIFW